MFSRCANLLFTLALLTLWGCDDIHYEDLVPDDYDIPTDRPDPPSEIAELLNTGPGRHGLMGWNILGEDYTKPDNTDLLSFEWDYFMIHDDHGRFTGSIGYLYSNPRDADLFGLDAIADQLVPKGGNIAVAGKFGQADLVAEYFNFGAGADYDEPSITRAFDESDDATGYWSRMTPVPADGVQGERLILEGQTELFAWNLTVSQDWPALSASDDLFVPVQGRDIGAVPDALGLVGFKEVWNVNMLWPRTRVVGTIANLETGEEVAIDGHGYRENSWGRWAFVLGGWDFATVSDARSGVMCAWQTYHFESDDLDYLDLGFVENGEVKLEHFKAKRGEFGWRHDHWTYDAETRQCIPVDATVVAENDRYRVEASAELGENQIPMLSDLTLATKNFVIEIQFPYIKGIITNLETGNTIPFEGQGGGEFANLRRLPGAPEPSDDQCNKWGRKFASPMP